MSERSEHTPGPWTILGENLDREIEVICEARKETVCIVLPEPDGEYSGRTPADARLIAAAPEMFEALSGLVDATVRDANEHGISGFTGARLSDARAALLKATSSQESGPPQEVER